MNETIGVKGGKNDRRRLFRRKKRKEKIEQEDIRARELAELEKKVKKQQRYTLIKTLPIVIVGGTIKTLSDVSKDEKPIDKEDVNSKWNIKEYNIDNTTRDRRQKKVNEKSRQVVIVTESGRKILVLIPDKTKTERVISNSAKEKEQKSDSGKATYVSVEIETKSKKEDKRVLPKHKKTSSNVSEKQDHISLPTKKVGVGDEKEEVKSDDYNVNYDFETSIIDENQLPDSMRTILRKLKSRRIFDEYQKLLKDVRYDLRELIFDYNVLVDQEDEVIVSKEAEDILDKLSDVIRRLEELKDKIDIENLDKYDDNYIFTLIEDYLDEFKNKNIISDIKDSSLYILIAEKLEELDKKKDKLSKKVQDKKDLLEDKEEKFLELKEKFYSIERFNDELYQFQMEQEALVREVQEKVKNAVDVSERVEIQFEYMNRQMRRLFRLLAFQMFLPGPKYAKGLASTAAAYLYFMQNIIKPKTTTKKYKVITVKDYSDDINRSLDSIDEASYLLGKTDKQIDKMIKEIKTEYADYLGVFKECDELLSNLKKMKSSIEEKKYEMDRIKQQQKMELSKNNAKVITRGEYPM